MRLARIGFVLVLLADTARAQRPLAPDAWADFDAYVAAAAEAWRIPGMTIAVVQGDSVVFARGYSVRTAGGTDSVSPHTLFANASTTKAFTALAAAILVDEGKLRWSDRVSRSRLSLVRQGRLRRGDHPADAIHPAGGGSSSPSARSLKPWRTPRRWRAGPTPPLPTT